MPQSGGKATFLHILERIVTGRVSCKFDKSASALEIYEQVTNFDVFNELLVQKSNLWFQQNILTNAKEVKAFIVVSYIIGVKQMLSIS